LISVEESFSKIGLCFWTKSESESTSFVLCLANVNRRPHWKGVFKVLEDFSASFKHRFWYSRKFCDVQAVAFIGSARQNPVQENHSLPIRGQRHCSF